MAYKTVQYGTKASRRNYSKVRTEVELPDLIEIQTASYKKFINEGLEQLFRDISPITNEAGTLELHFLQHHFDAPKYSIVQSKLRDVNYSRPLKVRVRLVNKLLDDSIKETELFMGDIPYMTPVGTFIINGAERVIISQIVRSSGVYFSKEIDKKTGQYRYFGQVIPTRGAWIEFEMGSKDIWYVKLDRSKKMPVTTLIKALGITKKTTMFDLFGKSPYLLATLEKDDCVDADSAVIEIYSKLRQGEKVLSEGARELLISRLFDARRYDLQTVGRFKYNKKLDVLQRARGLYTATDIEEVTTFDMETGEIYDEPIRKLLVARGTKIEGEVYDILDKNRHVLRREIRIDEQLKQPNPICECLEVSIKKGERLVPVKIIGNDSREESLRVTIADILASISYYFNLYEGVGTLDDIDHLGNRRLRLIGELLKNQFRIGLGKLEKNIKDRMSTTDSKEATAQSLINIKPLTSSLKEFFGSSQLSQFMDQINPLAEITQKRRISALGSGGIARDRAGVEVRDVHYSHYGRMCPIETPEGPSIGLITSLSTYAKVNEFGFIETPYLKCVKDERGTRITDDIDYLSADEEENYIIASAGTTLDSDGYIADEKVIARRYGETELTYTDKVNYMDVSPKQIISVATSCIPFLEHDDAGRALMGANMQRQAVPIIVPESPVVGTGMEHKAAHDCGSAVIAERDGIVDYVDAKIIRVKEEDGVVYTYDLIQYLRSNQDTAIIQRPIVSVGEEVTAGDIIADGQSMDNGELALGRNVRVGFMTWEGYNFEDAVIMSERLVKDDIYTSIHIDEYEIETRDTKLGKEEITREIPNVSLDTIRFLDANGIIIQGAEVKEGDILVGKVTPKGQTDPTPEEKLLLAIFGEKSREVRDTSLRVPHGGGGVVHSVQHFKKSEGDEMPPGVNEKICIYIVKKRKISEGDKMAGRHGNKGVISRILPEEDMPFTADGCPLDIMLNPQGVPSRMNIGQVLEIHLGMAAQNLGFKVATPVFDGVTMQELKDIMNEASMDDDGKQVVFDGRTGEPFENRISVGIMYMVKLSHMVDDKLHARSVGPYTLVTQQPMGGKAQNGGQRFGEMEVWALEAYGAAYTLQEMMTVKSDDIIGRNKVFRAIVDGKPIPQSSIPESFRVLTRELMALGLHVELISNEGENEVNRSLVDHEEDYLTKYGFNKHNPTINDIDAE